MGAISLLVHRDGGRDAEGIVNRMCDIQSHRGSHARGVRSVPGACLGVCLNRNECGPGGDAGYPVLMEDRRLVIVFDGIIFNIKELAAELGHISKSPTADQSEIMVLKSYLRWKEDCARHIDGVFSFAIWDIENSMLYAARDRLGEKSLFYHMDAGGELTLATEIKAILRNGRIKREVDDEAVFQYLFEKAFMQPKTPLKGIKALVPGCWLLWKDGRVETGDFWNVPYYERKVEDERYAVERYRDAVLHAIRKRMPVDSSEPGLSFSGGLDSSLLLGMMHRVSDRRIKTFSIVQGMSEMEREHSRELAVRFGTDHTEVDLSPEVIAENLADLIWSYDTPGVGALQAYFCAKEAARRGVNVMFMGFGVETTLNPSWFIPYVAPIEKVFTPMRLLPEKARTGIYGAAARMMRSLSGRRSVLGSKKISSILCSYFEFKRGLFRWYGTGLSAGRIKALFPPESVSDDWIYPEDTYRRLCNEYGSSDLHEIQNCVLLRRGLTINALPKFESAGVQNGTLVQFPFLDGEVIDFTLRLPFDLKCRNGRTKYVLRENCRQFVSDECAQMKKQAFAPPFGRWLTDDLWPIVDEVLSKESIEKRGVFDHRRIEELKRSFRSGESGLSWADIWALVTLELWLRMHVDPAPEDSLKPSLDWLIDLVI